jgi:hypothetical protein
MIGRRFRCCREQPRLCSLCYDPESTTLIERNFEAKSSLDDVDLTELDRDEGCAESTG